MSNKNLLLMIIDTNPILWSLYDTNIVKDTNEQHSTTKNSKFKITDFINSCVGFINAYIAMNQDNAIALIAAHNTKAYAFFINIKYFFHFCLSIFFFFLYYAFL